MTFDLDAISQIGIAIFRRDPSKNQRGNRRECRRIKLLEQVGGEFGELMLHLELDARRQESSAFEQTRQHRV